MLLTRRGISAVVTKQVWGELAFADLRRACHKAKRGLASRQVRDGQITDCRSRGTFSQERACCEAQISSRSLGSPYVELRDGLAPVPTVGARVVATTADEGW